MPRPTIICPQCHRELFNLRRPHCLWCGARISLEQFEQVAAPLESPDFSFQQTMPLLPPTYGVSPFSFRAFQRLNPFRSINGSISPWERKLRIAGAALGVCLVAAKLAEVCWTLWQLHQNIP